jgi:hypothetical protein
VYGPAGRLVWLEPPVGCQEGELLHEGGPTGSGPDGRMNPPTNRAAFPVEAFKGEALRLKKDIEK